MKRYLFFLRHYNDIDNIAPAMYFLLEQKNEHMADVIIYSQDYDFREDKNLKFLKESFGDRFNCRWLGSYFDLNTDKHFDSFKQKNQSIRYCFQKTKELIKNRLKFLLPFLFKIRKGIKGVSLSVDRISWGESDAILINKIVKRILNEKQRPKLVCFDVNRTAPVKGLLDALRHNGVKKIICLPVSPLINYNTLRQYDATEVRSKDFFDKHDYSGFDKIGFVDNYFVESFNKTFEFLSFPSTLKGKTYSLGSIRFCPKWLKIREEKLIKSLADESKKINVVFFLSHPKSNVNKEELNSTINLLRQFPEYRILIKSHTRFNETPDIKDKNILYTDEDSSALINWAEVILFWGSSIAIEGYIKKKTMVCLSYICGNINLFKHYNAGYIANCRDDLHEFLEKYKQQGKDGINYDLKGIDNLLDNIVPGGDKVIKNYLQFIAKSETDN